MEIYYIDRKNEKKLKEVVAGGRFLRWIYEHPLGMKTMELIIKKKFFSMFYGKFQDTPFSKRKIEAFVRDLSIDLKEAEQENIEDYGSFNEFFTRKLKDTCRPINMDDNILISPADGRILAYENIDIKQMIQVKGMTYDLYSLINNRQWAEEYKDGTCVVVRLNPSDYHRFHFPDKGIPMEHMKVKGHYYSVNPMALHRVAEVYCQNKREITVFNSENFGKVLLIEVGATCVGSIIQTYHQGNMVNKGEEKGYFKFGGSTVIMLLRHGQVAIDKDLLDNTYQGLETKVNMGEGIGHKTNE